MACHYDQESIVSLLLISGCKIDAKTHKNRSVVHFAAHSTSSVLLTVIMSLYTYENFSFLINEGDVMGDTPLHFAASGNGKGASWDLLIENGADPRVKNLKGITPLDIAANE